MKYIRTILVKINYALWALKRINRPHIGDIVLYNGEICQLIQGVRSPYWDLLPLDDSNMAKEKREVHRFIHSDFFKLDNSISRKIWAFKARYKFKIDNWLLIDVWGKSIFSPISSI